MPRRHIMLISSWTVQLTSGLLAPPFHPLGPMPHPLSSAKLFCGARNDDVKLKELLSRSDAKVVPVCEGKSLVTDRHGLSSAVVPLQQAEQYLLPDSLIFLGLEPEGVPVFGAACRPEREGQLVSLLEDGGAVSSRTICDSFFISYACNEACCETQDRSECRPLEQRQGALLQATWVNLRKVGPRLAGDQAALLALAQGLVSWNNNNAFCGRTGAPTAPIQGGHARSVNQRQITLNPAKQLHTSWACLRPHYVGANSLQN